MSPPLDPADCDPLIRRARALRDEARLLAEEGAAVRVLIHQTIQRSRQLRSPGYKPWDVPESAGHTSSTADGRPELGVGTVAVAAAANPFTIATGPQAAA
ncbi:hypothetical protein [Gemmata sp.]|uniref:hypothetical protein n=1 Tax=Gemmata sp. TaxID=1914242 RepID=UPI003F718BB0